MNNDYYGIYIEGYFQPEDFHYINSWILCAKKNDIKITKISRVDGKVNINFSPVVLGESNEN